MNIRYIEEPILKFGLGEDVCPKNGIRRLFPYDIDKVRPQIIKLGIIGKSISIELICSWLDDCKNHIPSKEKNNKPRLFTDFMGYKADEGFASQILYDESYIRKINNSDFEDTKKNVTYEKLIENIVQLYLNEIEWLSKNKSPDVILCVLPEDFTKILLPEIVDNNSPEEDGIEKIVDEDVLDNEESEIEQNFRRLLKAKAMKFGKPIQLVRDRIVKPSGEMQDPATIAWNFFTALYYKASGTPWGIVKKDSSIVCYAGISFYKSRDRKTTQTSIAQIFDELGKGVILRGDEILERKDDRIPHLTAEQAFNLIDRALTEYSLAVKISPQRLVIHKSSNYNEEEEEGFLQAAKKHKIDALDLVTILSRTNYRLFREHNYPPLRGTHLAFDDKNHLLYTRGSVLYYETSTSKYIPNPLQIRLYRFDESPNLICEEILALTKMNWNNTQFDKRSPITIECSHKVGEILKYLEEGEDPQLKYSFYM
ncbi:hypothetical protein GCM10011514_35740 [Emticicia aquatilis]|uniref:Protein argonaute n=1 Tax=Emticicia aquatilis TaxID=1537369 RepID=A0A917DTW3_9BACT|nr:hypothetical protein [Emticicia aquatilis]GGD68483.1 hypothetical protein GCM10011514_35740 [Emticicia aquatilis]